MIIDAHIHLPSPAWPGRTDFFADEAAALDYLRSCGITGAVFNTWQGVLGKTVEDLDQANRAALQLCEKYSDFLIPGAVIHPGFPAESRRWLKEFHRQNFRWVGELVPYVLDVEFDAPEYSALFELCAEQQSIVQLHNSPEIYGVLARFPQLSVVVSHIGEDQDLRHWASCENCWLDISGSAGGLVMGRLEKALEIMPPDRLLFGSDFSGYDPSAFLQRVEKTVADLERKNAIFYRNFQTLYHS